MVWDTCAQARNKKAEYNFIIVATLLLQCYLIVHFFTFITSIPTLFLDEIFLAI